MFTLACSCKHREFQVRGLIACVLLWCSCWQSDDQVRGLLFLGFVDDSLRQWNPSRFMHDSKWSRCKSTTAHRQSCSLPSEIYANRAQRWTSSFRDVCRVFSTCAANARASTSQRFAPSIRTNPAIASTFDGDLPPTRARRATHVARVLHVVRRRPSPLARRRVDVMVGANGCARAFPWNDVHVLVR